MNSTLRVRLATTPEQTARLQSLQRAFAELCNALAPVVQETRCWNRVALHHLAYRGLRERFPEMGSQMVCNAIHSVSRTCRLVYQHPRSPWSVSVRPGRPLPLIRFLPGSPVYFDRHTLSFKNGRVSMYTLGGRMRFDLKLRPQDEERFRHQKLCEIVLSQSAKSYKLGFTFSPDEVAPSDPGLRKAAPGMPKYLKIIAPGGSGARMSSFRSSSARVPEEA